jgi:hypothetical protein
MFCAEHAVVENESCCKMSDVNSEMLEGPDAAGTNVINSQESSAGGFPAKGNTSPAVADVWDKPVEFIIFRTAFVYFVYLLFVIPVCLTIGLLIRLSPLNSELTAMMIAGSIASLLTLGPPLTTLLIAWISVRYRKYLLALSLGMFFGVLGAFAVCGFYYLSMRLPERA